MSTAEQELERQRYPVGRFTLTHKVTAEQRRQAIEMLEVFPRLFRQEVEQRGDAGLERPYRPDGWTLRQLAHHVADSHSQAVGRLRMALTEDWPTIKPYDQEAWAKLTDASTAPVVSSLAILDGMHARMVTLLRSLQETDWARGFHHPENGAGARGPGAVALRVAQPPPFRARPRRPSLTGAITHPPEWAFHVAEIP